MFQLRTVLLVSVMAVAAMALSPAEVEECLSTNVLKCEAIYREAILSRQHNVNGICKATQDLIQCAEIDCGGDPWDASDDFLTHFVNFMEVTGLCSSPSLASGCARDVSMYCLDVLQSAIGCGETDPCRYYGMYSRCIIDAHCQGDQILLDFQDTLVAQIQANMPTKFGDEVLAMCPNWGEQIPVFDHNCDFMNTK